MYEVVASISYKMYHKIVVIRPGMKDARLTQVKEFQNEPIAKSLTRIEPRCASHLVVC